MSLIRVPLVWIYLDATTTKYGFSQRLNPVKEKPEQKSEKCGVSQLLNPVKERPEQMVKKISLKKVGKDFLHPSTITDMSIML